MILYLKASQVEFGIKKLLAQVLSLPFHGYRSGSLPPTLATVARALVARALPDLSQGSFLPCYSTEVKLFQSRQNCNHIPPSRQRHVIQCYGKPLMYNNTCVRKMTLNPE